MRENRTSGSVRGASGNRRSYREMLISYEGYVKIMLAQPCQNRRRRAKIPGYFDFLMVRLLL